MLYHPVIERRFVSEGCPQHWVYRGPAVQYACGHQAPYGVIEPERGESHHVRDFRAICRLVDWARDASVGICPKCRKSRTVLDAPQGHGAVP